ncbi:MAG: hypothetical protein IPK37_14215 [Austwickia sp.]|nr:MAG: hypothetical protein IPK37_14215 [Austwickia sp.]
MGSVTSVQHVHPPLVQCAIETERYVASAGWDQPVRLFALVETAKLLAAEPTLADQLRAGRDGQGGGDAASEADRPGRDGADLATPEADEPDALSAIEQDGLPPTDPLEDFLGMLAWPAEVAGVALAIERIVVPPEAEAELPDDPDEAALALVRHPARVDVRLLVAVTRDGESTCLLRQRPNDADDRVAIGRDIAPDLVAGLAATLED